VTSEKYMRGFVKKHAPICGMMECRVCDRIRKYRKALRDLKAKAKGKK